MAFSSFPQVILRMVEAVVVESESEVDVVDAVEPPFGINWDLMVGWVAVPERMRGVGGNMPDRQRVQRGHLVAQMLWLLMMHFVVRSLVE